MTSFALPPGLPRPVPAADGLDAPYWEGTRLGELRLQRCGDCQQWQWGPEWICHRCHSFAMTWPKVSPSGTIYSWERVWHPVHPALASGVPYLVVLVEIPDTDGLRVIGNLIGDVRIDPTIGEPVDAVFEAHDDDDPPFTLVQWRRR